MHFIEDFREIIDSVVLAEEAEPTVVIMEEVSLPEINVINELNDLVFKLRSHLPDEDGDVGYGVGLGMERAAEMIENLIKRMGS